MLILDEEVPDPEHLPCDDLDTVHLPVSGHDDLQALVAYHALVKVVVGGLVVNPQPSGDDFYTVHLPVGGHDDLQVPDVCCGGPRRSSSSRR